MADFLDKLDQAEKRDDVRLSNQPSGSSSLGDAHVVMTHDGSAGKHGKGKGKGAKDKEKKAKTKKGHEAKVGEKKPKKTAEKKGKKVKKGAEDQASGDNPTTAAEASAAASVPPPQDSTAQLADGDGAEPATEAPAGAPASDGESVGATLWKEKAGMDQLRSAGLVESKLLLRNLFRPMNWWRSDPEQANLARRPQDTKKAHYRLSVKNLRDRLWFSSKQLPAPDKPTAIKHRLWFSTKRLPPPTSESSCSSDPTIPSTGGEYREDVVQAV
uniref:Uncharacterized protein n=1 Tax=Haptolina ericina TaxID=156174 RepID=A0A7S3BRZ6_9EUKA